MSFKVHNLVKKRATGSKMEKAILMHLASYADQDGTNIFVSKHTIAAELEVSLSAVKTNTRKLLDKGLIVEVGKRSCNAGYTKMYQIALKAVTELPMAKDTFESHKGRGSRYKKQTGRRVPPGVVGSPPVGAANGPHGGQTTPPTHPPLIREQSFLHRAEEDPMESLCACEEAFEDGENSPPEGLENWIEEVQLKYPDGKVPGRD